MRSTSLVLALMCLLAAPCLAGVDPTVTAQVVVTGDYKDYVYHLINDADSGEKIGDFWVFMPESAARSVVSFTCTNSHWISGASFRGGSSWWLMQSSQGHQILHGAGITFTLRTPAAVPTSYTYTAGRFWYNWEWNITKGSTLLPVPVPEPSSLAAILAGLAGFGAVMRRRRPFDKLRMR